MKKIPLIILLLAVYITTAFAQRNVADVIDSFSNREYSKVESLNENEWKFARFVFSKIDHLYHDADAVTQLKDTLTTFWFDKVFKRNIDNPNSYTLDFEKVRAEAAKESLTDIPDITEFSFIGMKMPILEKTKSITHLELGECDKNIKSMFWAQIDKIRPSYELLVSTNEDNHKTMILKNKEKDLFSEFIMIDETGDSSIDLVWLKGLYDGSELTPPKDHDEK